MTAFEEGLKAVLLRHYRHPRGTPVETLEGSGCISRRNRTCGDRVTFRVRVRGETIEALDYAVEGCAVTSGLASILSEALPGRTVAESSDVMRQLRDSIQGEREETPDRAALFGDLAAALAVRDLTSRRECATIVLDAACAVLDRTGE